jgi:hypothetical protein
MPAVAALGTALTVALQVGLTAPGGHTPRVNVRWPYTVRATIADKPVPGRITAEIVDPIGGRHFVQLGKTTKKIRNLPFNGVFRDFVIWPSDARGIPLQLRFTVVARNQKRVVTYRVVPRA